MILARFDTLMDGIREKHRDTFPERRADVRFPTVYHPIGIFHAGEAAFGRCRNISDRGAKLELDTAVRTGDRVTIAFSPVDNVPGRIVWTKGRDCGVVFDRPIDCLAVLDHAALPAKAVVGKTGRRGGAAHQRLLPEPSPLARRAQLPARRSVALDDGRFKPGLRVRVMLTDGRECDGLVRWTPDDDRYPAGMQLIQTQPADEAPRPILQLAYIPA